MKAKELRKKTAAELAEVMLENKRDQFNLRMAKSQGQLTQPHQMKLARREVARVKTVLAEQAKAGKS